MQKPATFSAKIEAKLKQYREERLKQTGKRPFRETAIEELLAKALDGYEPPMPLEDRLKAIEKKLYELELTQAGYVTLLPLTRRGRQGGVVLDPPSSSGQAKS